MQDKIQEIMGLVLNVACAGIDYGRATQTADGGALKRLYDAEKEVESKLRELVREPLSDEEIADYVNHADVHGRYADPFSRGVRWGIRYYERDHGITSASGVE